MFHMTVCFKAMTLFISFSASPLDALIKKYPNGVMSLKERNTTGLVCPLQVSGVCRKLDIFINFRCFT